jgi:UDP-3-O-[3-hydroxymyristoyl] glucosamine N-acyltransferase
MPDQRFFESLTPVSLGELARLTGAELVRGDPTCLALNAAPLEHCDAGSVTFLADPRRAADLVATPAAACFVTHGLASSVPPRCALLVSSTPYADFAAAAERLHRVRIHPVGTPAVHPDAEIEPHVTLAAGVTVGPGAAIGRGTHISAGAVIGPGVAIGRDAYVGPNAAIGFALIGDRVRIYAGAVIGEAGFGATASSAGIVDVPQLGRVIIQDEVTIGANSCIDRGAYGDTVIGEKTKIDNLVQIGHNVVIGRNCVLAAHCGISGSVTIGDGCMFGGRVGVADHVTIGAGVRLAAASGIAKDIPAGETWGGYPARPMRQWLRETVLTAGLAQRRTKMGAGE